MAEGVRAGASSLSRDPWPFDRAPAPRLRRRARSPSRNAGCSRASAREHVAAFGFFLDQHPAGERTRLARARPARCRRCLRAGNRGSRSPDARRLLHVVAERSHARHDLVAAERLREARGDPRAHRRVRPIPLRFDDHRRRRVERPQLVADERRAARSRTRRAARRSGRSPPRCRRRSLRPRSAAPCSGCGTDGRRGTPPTGSPPCRAAPARSARRRAGG